MRNLWWMFVILNLTGCGAALMEDERSEIDSRLVSYAYKAGYMDGCNSGAAVHLTLSGLKYKRDESRFTTEAEYKEGWQFGYQTCLSKYGN